VTYNTISIPGSNNFSDSLVFLRFFGLAPFFGELAGIAAGLKRKHP